ncbi:hypothetical protein AALP_AA2G038200 [Arabis alpina]|uniref:Uncharacterized protein n=1 Tax=Arabis alpina TaxID=50452 RepID=A0A087HF65_ARAAL|nr:hypothetical protein AALP_AA2G038200 [Arabis alpina]
MIKRRFYKLEHGDKDSGSDSSCFSSDSDPEIEESEDSESESEDAVAQVSDDDSGEEEEESPAADDDDADEEEEEEDDGYRGRLEKTSMNRDFHLEEPPEEEEENYILGCMIKCNKVYKCRYCPKVICLNEISMNAHVASKKHAYCEKLHREKMLGSDDEVEKPSQIKGNRRSQRQGKSSKKEKLGTDDDEVDNKSETPSQLIKGNRPARRQGMMRSLKNEKLRTDDDEVDNKTETPSQLIKGNRRARRQGMMRSQKQEKVQGSSTTQRASADASQKARKKRRQSKD